jgi:poly(A) polymerase
VNQGPRKAKLRPSQDVLQRLRWDARFDVGSYLVVYRERGGGTKELPVPSFLESQRIPWSRVTKVLHRDRTLIWDRERRLDRLFGSGETPEEDLLIPGSDGGEGFGIALDPWSFKGGAWTHGASQAPPAASRPLRILTWNLLFDRFSPERIQSARRLPVQLELLEESQADVIALQEVTPAFYAALLAEPWVRERYWASEGPAAATLDPSGQAILSRIPLEAVRIQAFSSRKQAVVATLQTSEGRLVVVNLHLTSNQAERAEKIRLEQLRLLSRLLQRAHPDDDWIVLGDFNQREGEDDGSLIRTGAHDLWPEIGQGPGKTYDPSANSLADFFTSSGSGARFDRIYLRSRGDRWRGTRCELYATEAIPGVEPTLHPSDHFALSCELTPADGLAGEPVRSTALALVPPAGLWEPLQAFRREHDDRITRWPPHLNLLFGFVPPERFPAAIAKLGDLARAWSRPRLEISQVERFVLKREMVFYAAPAPETSLVDLQARVAEVFPGCPEDRAFVPHLTLGRARRAGDDGAQRAVDWSEALGPLAWEPDAFLLLARDGRGPYRVRASVPLGPLRSLQESLEDTGLLLSPTEARARAELQAALVTACSAAGAAATEAVGSGALGVELRTSDLDLALELPPGVDPRDEGWLSEFAGRLSLEAEVHRSQVVPAGEGVQLRLEVALPSEILRVDLQPGADPSQARAEAEAVLEAAGESLEAFRLGLRGVRAWARLRQLDRQAFGAFGGAAWAALAASVWESLEGPSPGDLIAGVLERIVEGGQDLGSSGARGSSASPSVFARSDPQHDLAASLRPSMWRALRSEARAALPLAQAATEGRGTWSGLFLPCSPPPAPRVLLHVEIPPEQREPSAGWVASVAHELLRRLESGGAQPRAYPTPSETPLGEGLLELSWAVGLRGALAEGAWERVTTWLERAARHAPPGARVSYELETS